MARDELLDPAPTDQDLDAEAVLPGSSDPTDRATGRAPRSDASGEPSGEA